MNLKLVQCDKMMFRALGLNQADLPPFYRPFYRVSANAPIIRGRLSSPFGQRERQLNCLLPMESMNGVGPRRLMNIWLKTILNNYRTCASPAETTRTSRLSFRIEIAICKIADWINASDVPIHMIKLSEHQHFHPICCNHLRHQMIGLLCFWVLRLYLTFEAFCVPMWQF